MICQIRALLSQNPTTNVEQSTNTLWKRNERRETATHRSPGRKMFHENGKANTQNRLIHKNSEWSADPWAKIRSGGWLFWQASAAAAEMAVKEKSKKVIRRMRMMCLVRYPIQTHEHACHTTGTGTCTGSGASQHTTALSKNERKEWNEEIKSDGGKGLSWWKRQDVAAAMSKIHTHTANVR